jgi:hypothetical protein
MTVTPPLITHQDLVLVERALVLARLEKARTERDQESAHVQHSQAGRQVGLDSLRARLGALLIDAGKAVAGREVPERAHRARPAAAQH